MPLNRVDVAQPLPDSPARRASPWAGLALAVGGAALAMVVNLLAPAVSAMLVAIVLGAILANVVPPEGRFFAVVGPGLAIASRRLLRLGVVLLGLQLVLGDIVALGWPIVAGVVAIVGGTMVITIGLGRLLRVGPTQTLLIAGGFSICGAAAVAGFDGVLAKRKDAEAATAVALVVIFGTGMIALMPALALLFGLDARTAGIWTGASTHEVAQVVAAAGIIGPDALKVAVAVKLARVLMLAPVLAIVALRQRSLGLTAGGKRPPLVPLFVAGFVAMVALRSAGVVAPVIVDLGKIGQNWLLAAAMFALGTSVHSTVLRRTGKRPLLLATAATVVVVVIGGVVAWLGR